MACTVWWALSVVWAQTGVVVLEQGGEQAPLEQAFATELALAAQSLVVARAPVGSAFVGLPAQEQVAIAAQAVDEYQTDAAVWLRGGEVSVWWPAGDRAVTVAVQAATAQPAAELALVVVQQLQQAHLYDAEPVVLPEAVPHTTEADRPATPRWTMAMLGQVEGDWQARAAARVGVAWMAERNVGVFRAGISGGQRWGRSQQGMPAITAMQASHVDLRMAMMWGDAVKIGPSVAGRVTQNQVSIQLAADRSDVTSGALVVQGVPGARVEVGSGQLAAVAVVEIPLAFRTEVWRFRDEDILRLGPGFWATAAGIAWRF